MGHIPKRFRNQQYNLLQVSQDLFDGVMFDIPQTSKLEAGYNTLVQYWVECGEEYADTLTGTVSLYN